MPDNFVSAVMQLFDSAKSAPAKDRANFTIVKKDTTPFVPRQHYIQILVNDMYLAKEREWWVRYAPVALVAPTYMYDNEYKTAPVIIGPALFQQFSKDIGDGTIIRNAPVSSMHPYWGGAVTLTVIFSKVEKEDNADKVLDVLETFADIASPLTPAIPFSSYLKIAGNVMNGMRVLLNLPKTQPILAYRETINPQINQTLEPQHLVLIDTPGLNDAEKSKFQVKNGQLYYGEKDASAVPYRKSDFILLEIAQGSQRSDEGTLAFYPLWEQTRRLGLQSAVQDGYWAEAKNQFNALKVAISESPDLTEPDASRLLEGYLSEMKKIRQGGAEEQSLGIKSPGEGKGVLQEYQRIAKQLDELDNL
jgi:hypothetical protein